MEGLLTEIVGSLIDRAANFTIGQVAQETTWKEWKSKNKLSKEDNNFLDIYVEAIVAYAKTSKPKELTNFFRHPSVIDKIKELWYTNTKKSFFISLEDLAEHFRVQEQIGLRYFFKEECDAFEKLFRNRVQESGSVIEVRLSSEITAVSEKIDQLLNEGKKLPRGFTYLDKPKEVRISSNKIKYQDYLESNNLPYIPRNTFQEENPHLEDFITESSIFTNLLEEDTYEGGIIFGEGGIGKTRLMLEIGQLALKNEWVVIKVLPEAEFIEDVLPALSSNNNYLLLFDYIEESKCFDSEVVAKLLEKNENLNVRALANCRYTYQASSNFPDTFNFLQIELKNNEAESKYKDFVVKQITKGFIQNAQVLNISFFDIKPSFAVFLNFLLYKEKLETNDIRKVGDFKAWIKKRLRLTFEVDDFRQLPDEVTYLFSILPLKDEQIDWVYDQGHGKTVQNLKNNGWIEEIEYKNTKTLKVIHDTIADKLLLIRLEYVRRDLKREIENIFNFSTLFSAQSNWIRSFERVLESPLVRDKTIFYNIFHKNLLADEEKLTPIKSKITLTPLLEEAQRFNLIFNAGAAFFEQLVNDPFFAFPLFSALNNGGEIEKIEKHVLHHLNKFDTHKNAQFVLAAFLNNGGKIEKVEKHVLNYLNKFDTSENAQFVIAAFLNNGGDLTAIKKYILNYLNKFDTSENAQFVLTAFLNNGGDPTAIKKYILNYLNKFDTSENAQFVLTAFLNNGGDPTAIKKYILNYLNKFDTSENAQFVFAAFLNNGGNLQIIEKHILNYLRVYATHENASFVFETFLNNGGNLQIIEKHILNYLRVYATHENASFVFETFLNNGGKIEVIQDHILNYLVAFDTNESAQFVLASFLNNGGKPQVIEKYALNYLNKFDTHENAQFVLAAFLYNGGKIEKIEKYILNYLNKFDTHENAQFVLAAFLNNGGDLQIIEKHLFKYLDKFDTHESVSFALIAFLNGQGKIEDIIDYIFRYLDKFDTHENARFLLQKLMEFNAYKATTQKHTLNYLRVYATHENASFIFKPWFDNGGELAPIKNFFLAFMRKNLHFENAAFHLAYWLKKGGEYSTIEDLISKYLNTFSHASPAGILLFQLVRRPLFFADNKAHYLNFLSVNISSNYSTNIIYNICKQLDDIHEIQNIIIPYLNKRAKEPQAQKVIATWINKGGSMELIKDKMIEHLTIHAAKYNTQHILSAWIRKNGDLNIILPYLERYLKENAAEENTGHVYAAWFYANNAPAPILSSLKLWLSNEQPDFVLRKVSNSLRSSGMTEEAYRELFEEQ